MCVRRLKLRPDIEQRATLRHWMRVHRLVYNRSLASMKNRQPNACLWTVGNKQNPGDFFLARQTNVRLRGEDAEGGVLEYRRLVRSIPSEVADDAFMDLKKAWAAGKAKQRIARGNGVAVIPFDMKFRSRHDESASINIRLRDYNHKNGMFAWLKDIRRTERKTQPNSEYGLKLLFKPRLGEFYLVVPVDRQRNEERMGPPNMVAIDPGVVCFACCYDSDGNVTDWARDDQVKLRRIYLKIDALVSKKDRADTRAAKRRLLKRRIARLYKRCQNLAYDLHHRFATFLLSTYNTILLPTFNVLQMVKRGHRNISKATARAMLSLSHYKFRQVLLAKARFYPGSRVAMVTKEYTSKACSNCGTLNRPRPNRTYHCASCSHEADRDHNGAINIMLEHIFEVALTSRT